MTTFEPLPPPTAHRGTPRARALAALAADLTANPGQWARIGTYGSAPSARTTASLIRRGEIAAFRPASAFEAEHRTDADTHTVWVRYAPASVAPPPVPRFHRDTTLDTIRDALNAYFDEVDPEDTDTDDLAETVLSALERAAATGGKP